MAIQQRLEQAKKEFDAAADKYKAAVAERFDLLETTAREKGDKKAVDQIKADRKAFEIRNDLPANFPATSRQDLLAARLKLDRAYTETIKDYVRLKLDDKVEPLEAERLEFFTTSAILVGKRKYLTTFKHSNVKVSPNGFSTNGKTGFGDAFTFRGEPTPHSIFLHPNPNGTSTVTFSPGPSWVAFHATVGIPPPEKADPNRGNPRTPITFELIGNGKSLWKSAPVSKMEAFQVCKVWLKQVKDLTLVVHCPGDHHWAWATWFEPVLIEPS
ncbi:MAG: NPCBM/NEW2 domain-containing protein [Gemmataceae bacterium]|nr:NPCBM/NEW2 domain-containing protein [Gemmataceae bacterium]